MQRLVFGLVILSVATPPVRVAFSAAPAEYRAGRHFHAGSHVVALNTKPVPLTPGRPCRSRGLVICRAVSADVDPWKVLGVSPGASAAEVKRAYRRRALKEHPDINKGPDAKERWQELSQAYDILSDPEKQRAWEAAKRRGDSSSWRRGPSSRGRSSPGGAAPKGPRQSELDAEYDAGGDTFGAILGDLFSAAASGSGGGRGSGGFVLEELLEFLEGKGARSERRYASDGSQPEEELRFAREELKTLQDLEDTLRTESAAWEKRAETMRAAGDQAGERRSMLKVFDARDRKSKVRRRVVSQEERVEYLEKVVFEVASKRSRTTERDGPGLYTIQHDGTKVAPTVALSNSFVAELRRGETVRVLEVVERPAEARVRARLEQPAGWISLRAVDTGYCWASRADAPSGGGKANVGASGSEGAAPQRPKFDADAALRELKRRSGTA